MRIFDHRFEGNIARSSKERALLLCALLSLAVFAALESLPKEAERPNAQTELTASKKMEQAVRVLREEFQSRGLHFDDTLDPNHTGLIGVEYSEMVTTLGSVEAKRTTTNPLMAGLIVRMLGEVGVARGDTIAVGCSGSFPALAVATLCASQAMGVHPVIIVSLGSSSYGADRTDWTLLDIIQTLKNKGLVDAAPAGISLGGSHDVGNDFEGETKTLLTNKIRSSGYPFICQPDLSLDVAERMRIYTGATGGSRITAFVNIGGSYADLGTDPLILKLEPGINRQMSMPEKEDHYGVVFAMAKRHIPVIHLLHIKGLVLKYGLPWDPAPLPKVPGAGFSQLHSAPNVTVTAISALYFILVVAILVSHRKEFFRTSS